MIHILITREIPSKSACVEKDCLYVSCNRAADLSYRGTSLIKKTPSPLVRNPGCMPRACVLHMFVPIFPCHG